VTNSLSVESVRGAQDVEALGSVLMHEHVFVYLSNMLPEYPPQHPESDMADAVSKLRALKELGFSTIVDLTVPGLGRDVRRVRAAAEAADINIVAATGIYSHRDLPMYFSLNLKANGPRFLEDFFVREIQEGIGDTGIRAAALKCSTDVHGVTPDVDTVLRSVARAHLRTGAPINTHTDAGLKTGLLQQKVFMEEGVDLSNVVIGHSGDTTDLDYLEALIEAGSYIGMDRFGMIRNLPLSDRIATIAAMCERGYASRMVLGHDSNCSSETHYWGEQPDWHYGFIAQDVLPALRDVGVSDIDLSLMTTGNPRAIFLRAAEHGAA